MKKTIFSILLAITLFISMSLLTFADSNTVSDSSDINSTLMSEEENEQTEKNIFEAAYDEIIKHSDKLFAAMAALSSVVLAIAYKKGLLPIIKGALSALASQVAKFKEDTEREIGKANESTLAITEKLSKTENILSLLTDKLDTVEKELSESADNKTKSEVLAKVMNVQVDLLYDIFMSSSLPQYQKEIVGEKISEMKKSISGEAENEN